VLVRPIRPDDAERLTAFHGRLSRKTIYYRFFSIVPSLNEKMLRHFVDTDYDHRLALVGVFDGQIIGVARYERYEGTSDAEVAFVVEDAFQGHGVGALLFERLIAAARRRGVTRFVADTLADNMQMLRLFSDMGFTVHRTVDCDVVHVVFDIQPTRESEIRVAARAHEALMNATAVQHLGRGQVGAKGPAADTPIGPVGEERLFVG
jgi:GNAT superfamily N-acetyltransferase